MPTQFANTLNNHPIYADRAEKDAAGNTITTTYQEKLTAGTGITIDSSNVISATGGGGGGSGMQVYHYTYTGSAMPLFTLNELTFSVNSSGYIQVQSSTVSTADIMILRLTNKTEASGSPSYFSRRNQSNQFVYTLCFAQLKWWARLDEVRYHIQTLCSFP